MAAELRESQKEIKSLSNSASPSAPRDTPQEERKSLLLKAVEKAGGGGLAAKEMYGAPPHIHIHHGKRQTGGRGA